MRASISVGRSSKLYKLVLSHIARTATSGLLEATETAPKGDDDDDDEEEDEGACASSDRIALTAAFGESGFYFTD